MYARSKNPNQHHGRSLPFSANSVPSCSNRRSDSRPTLDLPRLTKIFRFFGKNSPRREMLPFPAQVPAFTIFTPKKISRSILPSFFALVKNPRSVNKSTQVPATTNSDPQNSLSDSRQNSSLASR